MEKKKIVLTIFLIFALLFSFCLVKIITYKPKITYVPSYKLQNLDTLNIGVLAIRPQHQYPGPDVNLVSRSINTQIFEGLVGFDNTFKLIPLLAEKWENPDDLTWRFYLRKNVKFHDGSPFTAEDVKFTIDETIKEGFYGKNFLQTLDKANILDNFTVDIVTKKPDPILANKLAFVWIFNKNYKNEKGELQSIGTGPYKLESWDKEGKEVVLVRNENYWGKLPEAKKVVFKNFETDQERLEAVEKGEIDVAYLIEGADSVNLGKEHNIAKIFANSDYYVSFLGFDFGNKISPYVKGVNTNPFLDIRVRKAIYQGIDMEKVVKEAFGGLADIQTQAVTKDIFGYNFEIQRYPYDPQAAKNLLKEAGYPNGFTVNLDTSAYETYFAKPIAESLKEIGIQIIPTQRGGTAEKPNTEDYEKWSNGDTSLFIGWIDSDTGDAIQGLINYFHSPDRDIYDKRQYGMFNTGRYQNKELDQILDKANVTLDQKERLLLMQKALKILHDDVAFVPLCTAQVGYAVRQGIDFKPRPDSDIKAYEIKREAEYVPVEQKATLLEKIFSF